MDLPSRFRGDVDDNALLESSAVAEIPLVNGGVALVDTADYEWLSQYDWRRETGKTIQYAVRRGGRFAHPPDVLMHREILGIVHAGRTVYADHINHDGLDNRRVNLRITGSSGNQGNSRRGSTGTSSYRGVHWNSRQSKWCASIRKHGQVIWLGVFSDELEAARAYDIAALAHWGEFASPNFPSRGGE